LAKRADICQPGKTSQRACET
nr:RecName: Full=U27-ctenitoxin-Pn1a; Short=U27-CNTX-Pn1a; AltName: Full=Toxin PnV2 [Phoneutria nigriventer]AAB28347.1 PNV2 toxin=vascular smooth muscle contracting polypeptide {N-terminal} [Phoneutria nigriventer=armed spiders, venom, Peptide Partial, 20 aa] [Phoneutria nigriventer]